MRAFMRPFLRAKHWEIFCLLVFAALISGSADHFLKQGLPGNQHLGNFRILLAVLSRLGNFMGIAWIWIIGSYLSSILPPTLKPKIGYFYLALAYSSFYLLEIRSHRTAAGSALDLMLGMLGILAAIYLFCFVARCLDSAETREPSSFTDYFGTAMLVFLLPIGIWFLQPRVNCLCIGTETNQITGQALSRA